MSPKYRYNLTTYMGKTGGGLPRAVFWDPHTQIKNNKPPGTFISGAPGSGKTYHLLNIAAASAIAGKTTTILDYKGDFVRLKYLEDEIGEVNFWPIAGVDSYGNRANNEGSLDPFYLTKDREKRVELVTNLIEIFVGPNNMTPSHRRFLPAVIRDTISDKNNEPSMNAVISKLRRTEDEKAKEVVSELKMIESLPNSAICFAPKGRKRKPPPVRDLRKGVTVITLDGLTMPKTREEAVETQNGRLASGILYLIMNLLETTLRDDATGIPKTLLIDEAWALLATPQGGDTIKAISLLGRSKKNALILASQNYDHIGHLDLENTIASRFAFNAESKEAAKVLDSISLNQSFLETITELETGMCLMKDWEGNFSTMQVEVVRDNWHNVFTTNPFD